MDEAISSPQGLVGKAFEDWLTHKYGGEGAFRVDGRDFDGGQGNRWWEAKSGRYWVDYVCDEIWPSLRVIWDTDCRSPESTGPPLKYFQTHPSRITSKHG